MFKMRKSIAKFFVLVAACMPFQSLMVAASKMDAQQALLQQIVQHLQGPSADMFAKAAIDKIPAFDQKNIIIGATEGKELLIADLAKKLDKTETNIGSQALRQSLKPIADLELITKRQNLVKAVADDKALYTNIKNSLKRIKKSEYALLAYWDQSQRENSTKLFARAEYFYYSTLQKLLHPAGIIIQDLQQLNDTRWALEASMIQEMGSVAFQLLFYIGLQGVLTDTFAWYTTGAGNKGDPRLGNFSIYQSVINGYKSLFNMFIPKKGEAGRMHLGQDRDGNPIWERNENGDYVMKKAKDKDGNFIPKKDDQGNPLFKVDDQGNQVKDSEGKGIPLYEETKVRAGGTIYTFTNCVKNGTLADKYIACSTDFNNESRFDLGFIGKGIKKLANSCGYECKKIEKLESINPLTNEKETNYAWYIGNRKSDGTESTCRKAKNTVVGVAGAAGITYWQAIMTYEAAKATFLKAKNIINTMKELHVHTIHLARAINAAKKIAQELEKNPAFKDSTIVERMNKVLQNPSSEMKRLLELVESKTFLTTNAKTQLYSRGNVLLAHRLMSRVRDEIVPLLQGIAELDALCALVANMQEMASTKTPFSFAEFVPGAQAMVDLENAWLPLVRNAVPNTIMFGGDKPNKIIITGPNGGGKSVFLKLLGVVTILAQSWGVVPAQRVRMTMFDGLRSCIHPEESLEHELSTFMAEKMRIDEIKNFVFSNNNGQFKVMLLLDEPFRGTVDAESADRIYDFGKDVASLPQSIVLIATHVEKPVKLAQDTNNAFANYHVCIKELQGGRFEREFRLEPGILEWWFKDNAKRSRFIDFVTMEKHKEQIAKMMAEKQAAKAAVAA
jgi:energy-coupling factor transporter ATP-binding protein EcfA2